MTPDDWKRVKAIASEAWARPADDRARYIAGACAGDAALEREVSSLVAAMAAAGDRFEVPPRLSAGVAALAGLVPGRLGAYEILSPIGAGGMGEVYKARDTRLDRIVAIKVLPGPASADPASRARMEREARAVAALNHPHICTLYDIGSQDGLDFLVMEYVEGETLASRLARGLLPVEEALLYAEQTASALQEAHRAGIVHRDVKPANIMLAAARSRGGGTPQAKLLDFGIAKAPWPDAPTPAAAGRVPTPGLTQTGFVVGTAQYMAPEQFDLHATDARTDIFAFGTVLFEMLTGRKAFEGANSVEVGAAIRDSEAPSVCALRQTVPPSLDRIVARCLAKRPDDRYQSVEALLADLRDVRQAPERSSGARPAALALTAAALVLAGVVAWTAWTGDSGSAPAPSVTRLAASAGVLGAAALSPDGSAVAFPWAGEGVDNPELVLLPVGSTTRVILTKDPGVEEWPAWSPDGKSIAFIRCGNAECGIFVVPAGGGPERRLRSLRADRYNGLAWSPDGQFIAYAERQSLGEPYALFLLHTDSLEPRRLAMPSGWPGIMRFAYSPDGGRLAAVHFDDNGISVHLISVATGTWAPLIGGQREWFGGLAWNADGRHLILSANQRGARHLWRLPVAGGGLEQVAVAGEDAYYPTVSGRGGRLAFVHEFREWDLSQFTVDERGPMSTPEPFASSTRLDLDPAFSPDGRTLAFVSERGGTREVWVSAADGGQLRQMTSMNGQPAGKPSWSPDGRFIAFHASGIHVIPAGGGPPREVADIGEMPTWSADGRWVYFRGRLDGRLSIWKVPAEGGQAVRVIASDALVARENDGGTDLYFARVGGGIWHRPTDGGRETPLIPDFKESLLGYWTVAREGIYYVAGETHSDQTVTNRLRFFDFASRRTTDLGTLVGIIEDWVGGLTLSGNRRSVVYSHRTYKSSEVRVVEHFR